MKKMTEGYMNEERRMMQRTAREFTLAEVLPVANDLDPEKGQIPRELINKMGEMGYFGITIPEDKGGLGLGCFEYCLIAEELARGWMSVASIIARGNGFWRSVPGFGPLRDEKIARMAMGDYLGAFAMSEPNAGSDMAGVSCRATRDGSDWIINGNKYWCTFADGADFISVVCRVESDSESRQAGMKSIAVEKPRGELPAGVQGSPIPKIGYHGWKTWELHFDNVRVPAIDAPAEDGAGPATMGGGFVGIQRGLEVARAHTAARSIGAAQGALNVATDYASEREQFGSAIGKFQSIRFKIATAATEIEAARQLMYHVCTEIDNGRRADKEAAMVKYFAAEMSERVTSECLQIMGGAGYTTHYPVERYWRDARLTKIFEGTSEIMQRIISDRIMGK
ncbi:MAG: acyl-CoA dehydrogenase [Gammaproteobacteria bacterium]|nr:acyl-CoA dehydrogenase [Gammaproteobacteria bacterium]HCC45036.1 acyl-CoA dehydrogenase [Gammaproteobacteria bacterium]